MGKWIAFAALLVTVGCVTTAQNPVTLKQKLMSAQAVVIEQPPDVVRLAQDVTLEWTRPKSPDADQVVSYNVYVSTEPDFSGALVVPVGNVTNTVVRGLLGYAKYYFAVTDLSPDGGESDLSKVTEYTTKFQLEMRFWFNEAVHEVRVQCSSNLIDWQDCFTTETNGIYRVEPDVSESPRISFRAVGVSP